MKRLALFLTALLTLSGCDYSINGVLNVLDTIQLDGETYRPGNYDTSVTIKKTTFSKRYKLKMKMQTYDGTKTYSFKAPKGAVIPENGTVNFSASQLNANYGVKGEVQTDYTEDRTRRSRYESCQYEEPYTICHSDPTGRTRCYTQYRTRYGNRHVEYYTRTKAQDLEMSLMKGDKAVANFTGESLVTYPVYTYQGICR